MEKDFSQLPDEGFEQLVDPAERTFFIERTGVTMRWILISACSVIQFIKPVVPMRFYYVILPIAIAYNFSIRTLLTKWRKHISAISLFTGIMDIIVSVAIIFMTATTDIYLWYFVLLVSHAARFGFAGAILSPVLFSLVYTAGLLARGYVGEVIPVHSLLIRSTFFVITGLVSGYLAREERRRFDNILKQQRDLLITRQKRKELRDVLQRYVSYNVVDELLKNPDAFKLGGTKRKISVLFSDIEGFTRLLSRFDPEKVIRLLNEYLTEMTNIIFEYDGMVDKFVGDAIIGIFGAFKSYTDNAARAVKSAFAMQKKLEELQIKWRENGIETINARIAVNTGSAILGNVGSPKRMDYTAIGDTVNTASRLQSIAQLGKVVISGNTYGEVMDIVEVKNLGNMQLKGKSEPTEVYEVLSIKK